MRRYGPLTVVLLLLALTTGAQMFAGSWRGRFHTDMTRPRRTYPFELELYQEGPYTWGYYRTIDSSAGKTECACLLRGEADRRDSGFVRLFREDVLANNVPYNLCSFVLFLEVRHRSIGLQRFVTGKWFGRSGSRLRYDDASGSFEMEKVSERPSVPEAFTQAVAAAAPARSVAPEAEPPLAPAQRSRAVFLNEQFDSLHVRLQLFDNGFVDGDTVSLLLNNVMLLERVRLTERPIEIALTLRPDFDNEILLVAENLGRFPPNTAWLVVDGGGKHYELAVASTLRSNALLLLRTPAR